MTQLTQNIEAVKVPPLEDTEAGNTKTASVRSRTWMLTWNNYSEEEKDNFTKWVEENCIDYAINPEVGKNGTPHLQIFIEFKNPRTFSSLKKRWNKPHIEQCWKPDKAKVYCSKEDTRVGETILPKKAPPVKDPLEGLELKDWQKRLLAILNGEPDERKVIWIYDSVGNSGKTTLAKHLCIKYPDEALYLTGGPSNCKYGVTSFLYSKTKGKLERNHRELKIALFDFTRSQDDRVSYQAIEEIKNGIFFNTKYESMMVTYNKPHVVIFSNFYPELNKLSQDRWDIWDLELEELE